MKRYINQLSILYKGHQPNKIIPSAGAGMVLWYLWYDKDMQGVYLLLIKIKKPTPIQVGKLGKIKFKSGNYIYIGSAQNGLEKRIQRHFKKSKPKHWHIDYLLAHSNARIETVYCLEKNKTWECKLTYQIAKTGEGIPGFGCSDCGCPSHLYRITKLNLPSCHPKPSLVLGGES